MSGGEYTAESSSGAKSILKDSNYKNVEVSAKVKRNSTTGGDAGLMFLAKEISSGVDSFKGYYAAIAENKVVLGKMSGSGYEEISSASFTADSEYHDLKVVCKNGNIKVYVDGSLKINSNDSTYTEIGGNVGVRSHNVNASFDDVKVSVFK